MIILNGATGSGKSTTLRQLGELGYRIIPTYSTRPPRATDDKETICLDKEEYLSMIKNGDFLTTFTAYTVHGEWYYGLLREDFCKDTLKSAVVGNYFFTPMLLQYLATKKDDIAFSVFIKVDRYAILQENGVNPMDPIRNADLIDRLKRDNWKCAELREHADFIMDNPTMEYPPEEVTSIIHNAYHQALARKGVKIQ